MLIADIENLTFDEHFNQLLEPPGAMKTFWPALHRPAGERELLFEFREWKSKNLEVKAVGREERAVREFFGDSFDWLEVFAWATANAHFPLLWTVARRTIHCADFELFLSFDFCHFSGMPDTLLAVKDTQMFHPLLTWSRTAHVRWSYRRAWEKADQDAIIRFYSQRTSAASIYRRREEKSCLG